MKKKDIQKLFPGIAVGTMNEAITNPFSGNSIELNPTEVAVYDYLKGCEMLGDYKMLRKAIDWFIDNNIKAYSVLID
jgi:hypothetical protein